MQYYRFEVRLRGVEPSPMRRFLIQKTASFEHLHLAIQDACGWENCHLFAFREPRTGLAIAGVPGDSFGPADPDATRVKVATYFKAGARAACLYEYDFGDGWCHEMRLIESVSISERFVRRLEEGTRAFPPEDCGGIPGYEKCVSVALGQPSDEVEDPEELRAWLGGWHPERFDLAAVKRRFDL